MPQLDTIFISMVFSWAWLMLYLMMKKTTAILMTVPPKIFPHTKINKHTLALPWT